MNRKRAVLVSRHVSVGSVLDMYRFIEETSCLRSWVAESDDISISTLLSYVCAYIQILCETDLP